MKYLTIAILLVAMPVISNADWVLAPTYGQVMNVGTYQVGSNGLRAKITLKGVSWRGEEKRCRQRP